MRGTRQERRDYHALARETKADTFAFRRKLGDLYLARHAADDPGALISPADGFGRTDLSALAAFGAARAEAHHMIASRQGGDLATKGSLDFFAEGKSFTNDSAIIALATHPAVLAPVIRYLGCLPILFSVDINRASLNEIQPSSSHAFHLDPEDTTQVKVFVLLTDVEPDRAFHALPAHLSDTVVERLGHTMGRLTDAQVRDLVGLDKVMCGAGPAGSALFCDTNRCFHYGGRPGRLVRDMITISYVLPTSTWYPLDEADGSRRKLMVGLQARAGDAEWNALIAAKYF